MTPLKRRLRTVPAVWLAWMLVTAITPVAWPALVLYDLFREATGKGPSYRGRTWLMVAFYLLAEVVGLTGILLVTPLQWISADRFVAANYFLQRWWVSAILGFTLFVWRMRTDFSSLAAFASGPVVILTRHTSLIDTGLVPMALRHHRVRTRYILKDALLWDPCMDLVGARLDMGFVSRTNRDADLEVIRRVCRGLTPTDAVVLYPEGTRFEAAVRDRIADRFDREGRSDAAAYTRSLKRTLPPRPAGALAVFSEVEQDGTAPDIVFWAHTGFESAVRLKDVLSGGLLGRTVRLRCWRVPLSDLPDTDDERAEWLNRWWKTIDEAVDEILVADGTATSDAP